MAARSPGALVVELRAGSIVCDAAAVVCPDAVTVDVLARLSLVARRSGLAIVVSNASAELRDLVAFMGLDDVVRLERSVEPGGHAEQREQVRGVEEEADAGDAVARRLDDL